MFKAVVCSCGLAHQGLHGGDGCGGLVIESDMGVLTGPPSNLLPRGNGWHGQAVVEHMRCVAHNPCLATQMPYKAGIGMASTTRSEVPVARRGWAGGSSPPGCRRAPCMACALCRTAWLGRCLRHYAFLPLLAA